MSRTLLAASFALLLGACAAPPPVDPMAGMLKPSEQHMMLLQGIGSWEGTLTAYWPGADGKPVPAKEVVEPIGGFWTQSRFTCDFMGMPYVGTGCMGYDTLSRRFVGTWNDSMSSELSVMTGEMDPIGSVLVMRWATHDPVTHERTQQRSETTFSKDGYISTFFTGAGAGTRTMLIEMKRKPGGH
jgi:hypothetical protein